MKMFLLVLTMLATSARADDWSTTDKVLGAAALTLTVADWLQTRQIAREPLKWQDDNAILGEHPSVARVNKYFATGIVIGAVAAYYTPAEYRKYLLGGVIAVEATAVAHNYRIGVRVQF